MGEKEREKQKTRKLAATQSRADRSAASGVEMDSILDVLRKHDEGEGDGEES